jgi:hypothetical protein
METFDISNARYSENGGTADERQSPRRLFQRRYSMKEIPLSQGKVALVDNQDYEWLTKWKWSYFKCGTMAYAARHTPRPNRKTILMHREIMNAPNNVLIDHADRNGLNNQRYNLRNSNKSQNSANSKKYANCASEYKGVSPSGNIYKNLWRAEICVNRKGINLGYYQTQEEAARAYDKAAIEYFGEFAHLNFPQGEMA